MPIHANQYADITNHEQLKDFKFEQRCPRYEEGSPKSSMLLIMLKAYHSFRTASREKIHICLYLSASTSSGVNGIFLPRRRAPVSVIR